MATAKKKATKKKLSQKKIVTKKAVKKKAIKKAPVKNSTVKKPTAKKKLVKKASKKITKTPSNNIKIKVTHEQHYKMTCEAAYYISLGRTHDTVNPTEDWFQAEAAINKICIISE